MGVVYGRPYDAGELANTAIYQAIRMNDNAILKAVRVQVVIYNDPTFTDLNCKIYADHSGVVGGLLATSTDSRTKAELTTLDNAWKETYFNFNDVNLQKDTWYNIVINGTGYSGADATNHVAWVHAYPDPILTGYTAARETINQAPFYIVPIWSEF